MCPSRMWIWTENSRSGRSGSSGIARAGGGRHFDDRVGQGAHRSNENFDDRAIKLRVGAPFELCQGIAGLACLLVSAVASNRVVGVGDGDDARSERDFFAGKGFGVTRTVKVLVVV